MIKKLVSIGFLTIAVVFLSGCVQEKAFIKSAETINQSITATSTVINQSSKVTPTVQPIKPNRVELGNFGYSYYDRAIRDFQNQPEINWDVILNQNGLVYRRPNTTIVFQDFIDQKKFEMTDLSRIQSRFEMATKFKDKYDYGVFLLMEEVFHPVIRVEWGWSNMSRWKIEGSDNFEGVQVKLFKTWYIEKYKKWDQNWWNNIVSNNKYKDPIVWKWSEEYGYNLYEAWNKHMKNLSKKSAIIGLNGLTSDSFSNEFEYYYPSPMREYVVSNYDLLFTYMDPINSSEIIESENQVKDLRKKFNYRGKIAHILTSSFRNKQAWNETIAFEEFKIVHPYVDVIMVYPYADEWNNPKIPYPPKLINFSRRFNEKNR
jgi:hypothetical protein